MCGAGNVKRLLSETQVSGRKSRPQQDALARKTHRLRAIGGRVDDRQVSRAGTGLARSEHHTDNAVCGGREVSAAASVAREAEISRRGDAGNLQRRAVRIGKGYVFGGGGCLDFLLCKHEHKRANGQSYNRGVRRRSSDTCQHQSGSQRDGRESPGAGGRKLDARDG